MTVLLQVEIPSVDWAALSPLLVMAGAPVFFLTIWSLASGWLPKRTPSLVATAAGIGTIVAAAIQWARVDGDRPQGLSTLASAYGVDNFSMLLTCLIAAAVTLTAIFAHDYLEREDVNSAEFFVLLMLSAAGGMVMAGANDLIVLFLGLEVLSIAVYILAAAHLRKVESQEAGMKYFVLGAFSSAFLLYGIALIYGATGSTSLLHIRDVAFDLDDKALLYGGMALLLVGLAFKIAAVPFHQWTPDVYDGSPSPVVSFMASAVKVGGFAALLRVFHATFRELADDWAPMIFALAVASMLLGTIVGLVQDNVKRMLAYSSISHAGFILVGAEAATSDGMESALYYLTAYTFIALGSFAVLSVAVGRGDATHSLADYRGLARRQPVLALAFTILLFAQAGVPFTTGFLGKFFVISAAIDDGSYGLAIVAMIAAVIGAALYLRIVLAMFSGDDDPADGDGINGRTPIPRSAMLTIGITVVFTVFFGIFANLLVDLIDGAAPVLVQSAP